MWRKLISFLVFSTIGIFSLTSPVFADDNKEITIHFFEDRLCSTCAAQKEFMNSIKGDYPNLDIKIYSISDTDSFQKLAEERNIKNYSIMAPTSFIGDYFLQLNSFDEKQKTTIIDMIEGTYVETKENLVIIPFLNKEVNLDNAPLLLTTIILSTIDGLNVCSIGALILILSIVLVFNSRRKILAYGGIFLLTTAIIYGGIVFTWGKAFELLLGQLEILRIIVGLSGLIGGIYFFKQFLKFHKNGPGCESSNSKIISSATSRVKKVFENENAGFFITAAAVAIFAAIIVIVELPCSIGIPIVFVGILAENSLSLPLYIFYLLVYVFFYLLIEIVVFLVAVFNKKIWLSNSKATTWTTLIGALFLFYIAFYYLF